MRLAKSSAANDASTATRMETMTNELSCSPEWCMARPQNTDGWYECNLRIVLAAVERNCSEFSEQSVQPLQSC